MEEKNEPENSIEQLGGDYDTGEGAEAPTEPVKQQLSCASCGSKKQILLYAEQSLTEPVWNLVFTCDGCNYLTNLVISFKGGLKKETKTQSYVG